MARRRKSAPGPKTALTDNETNAVGQALVTLYKRALYHLVAPRFNMAGFHLPAVYRTLVPDDVHKIMEQATQWALDTTSMEARIPLPRYPAVVFYAYTNGLILPNLEKLNWGLVEANMPHAFYEYGEAANACRNEWMNVHSKFVRLNAMVTRSTLGFFWPCVSALLNMRALDADGLTGVTRPGNLPAEFVAPMRETNAFVMQHTLLPKIDNLSTNMGYEGDRQRGVAAKLALNTTETSIFPDNIWPVW